MRAPKEKETGKPGNGKQPSAFRPGQLACLPFSILVFPISIILLAAPACSTTKTVKKDPDPLKEPVELKKGGPAATTQTKSVPPIPDYDATISTASLAVNLPLTGPTRPSGIPDEQAKAPVFAGGDKPGPVPPSGDFAWNRPENNGTQPVLGPPQPVPVVPATLTGNPKQWTAPGTMGTPTYEQLQDELRKRGVLWQKVDQTTTGVLFRCAVPHPQNPQMERIVEMAAPDTIRAMQAALVQIDYPQ
jgi:hypothetical protein